MAPSPSSWRRGTSLAAYYVALAGVAFLLIMLLLYCLCFMVNKVKELTQNECTTSLQPARKTTNYPVPAEVREGARKVARLYDTLPTATSTDTTSSPHTGSSLTTLTTTQ